METFEAFAAKREFNPPSHSTEMLMLAIMRCFHRKEEIPEKALTRLCTPEVWQRLRACEFISSSNGICTITGEGRQALIRMERTEMHLASLNALRHQDRELYEKYRNSLMSRRWPGMIADIRVVRDCGQYAEGPSGLSVRVWDYGEEINEIFVYDQEVPVFLAEIYHALTTEQRASLNQIIDAEEVAP